MCSPVKFANFLRETFLQNTSGGYYSNYTNASAVNLLHIRTGNLDWCKCGHCKNEAREIGCLSYRQVDERLIASAKIPGSISPSSFYE